MAIHTLTSTQIVQAGLAECWTFFSDPRNLARITPPALDFRINTDLPAGIYAGLMIEYRIRPLLGIPVTWLTEITEVEVRKRFVDEQRIGPYQMWRHEHFFKAVGDGRVEVRDQVRYVLPFGWIGEVAHALFVKRKLRKIFDYREKVIAEIF